MSDLIIANEIPGAAVYGVKQFSYTVDGEAGRDYAAALAAAAFKESVAIEDSTSAYADVVRQRQRKVEDLGNVLAAIAKAISTMDPKSNDPNKRSTMSEELYDAQALCNKYGITLSFAAVSASATGGTASITYANATKAQNDIQYALDTENNNLQQDTVSLQSLISKRDNAYSSAAKLVNKASDTASSAIHNFT